MRNLIKLPAPLLFVGLLTLSSGLKSQDLYPLHPSVGDSIDVLEKLDYSLFPFVANKGFQYGLIRFRNENFELDASYDSIPDTTFVLNQDQLVEAQQNIEKINAYYRLKAEEAKKPKTTEKLDGRPTGKTPVFFNNAAQSQIGKEARMNMRLQEDARRMLDHNPSAQPNQLRIEFK